MSDRSVKITLGKVNKALALGDAAEGELDQCKGHISFETESRLYVIYLTEAAQGLYAA